MNKPPPTVVIAIMILLLMAATISYQIGRSYYKKSIPVCHSEQEDSKILDCDYHDGGWYQK